jgi:flagellar basal-body rod modification protein FlgD
MATKIEGNSALSSLMGTDSTKKTQTKAEEAQDRFMKLLVTQMQNQDPLNPLDNAQVTSQLAQLSTVTGIDKMNTTLESMIGSFTAGQSLQATTMIGRSVLVPGNSMTLANGGASFGIELAEPADKVLVTVRDANGKAVQKMDIGAAEAGTLPLVWDGKTDSGASAANGKYTFEVSARRGSDTVTATSLATGTVGSVATGSGGVKLELGSLGSFSMNDVRRIQ